MRSVRIDGDFFFELIDEMWIVREIKIFVFFSRLLEISHIFFFFFEYWYFEQCKLVFRLSFDIVYYNYIYTFL